MEYHLCQVWHGPAPHHREHESHFLLRLALFSFGVFIFFFVVYFTWGYLAFEKYPSLQDNFWLMGIFAFAPAMLGGMGLLGGIFCLIKGLWLLITKRDFYYTHKPLYSFLPLFFFASFSFAALPPPSPVIKDVSFSTDTHIRLAPGSDNWAITWAKDGDQYTVWGDGGGFEGTNSRGRVSLGVARVTGTYDNYSGKNVYGGYNSENSAVVTGKSYGLVAIGATFYMWVGPGSGGTSLNETVLQKSTDSGASWHPASWKFVRADGIGLPTILNYGPGYDRPESEDDGFVYHYFVGPASGLTIRPSGQIYLARVHKDNIFLGRSHYEFFNGLNSPWSNDIHTKKPILELDDGVGWTMSVSYNEGLGRYILCTEHTESIKGNLAIFDAPTPWGPWTTVLYETNWEGYGTNFFWNFSNKWLSADGKDFTLIFTGTSVNDSWNTIRGSFTLTGLPNQTVVKKWERFEVILPNDSWTGNEFDVELVGHFTNPSGDRTLSQFGFYAGDNTWKIFFMPDELDEWTYTTTSSDPDLDNHTGSFLTVSSDLEGTLKGEGNRWKMSDGDYDFPLIWQATSSWQFRSGSGTDPEIVGLLDHAANTVNARLMSMGAIVLKDYSWAAGHPQINYPYEAGKEGQRFHIPFWDKMNEKLDAMRDRGMGMYYMFYTDDGLKPDNVGIPADFLKDANGDFILDSNGQKIPILSKEELRLFRYAIARLAPYPNILWDSGIDISEFRKPDWVTKFVDHFKINDPWKHPVSSRNSPGPIPSNETYRSAGGSGNGGKDIPTRTTLVNNWDRSSIPIAHTDHYRIGISRGNWDNESIRRVTWRMGLSGHQGVLIDYGSGSPSPALIQTGSDYVSHATRFFKQEVLWGLGSLDPHDELLSEVTHGLKGREVILSANIGKEYVVYASSGGSFTIDLSGTDSLQTRWYNPRTNVFQDPSTISGGIVFSTAAPSSGINNDWVLHLYSSPDATAPTAPRNLVATAVSSKQINLTWDPSTDPESGIDKYYIYRNNVKVRTSQSTSFTDTGLSANTLYTYRVSAVNIFGLESAKSNSDSATTHPGNPDPSNIPPVAILSANPILGSAPLTVYFDARASFDPDGDIVRTDWDFGDNQTSTEQELFHVYNTPGDYLVTLTVTDNEDATDDTTLVITVFQGSGTIPPEPNPDERKRYDKVLDLTQTDHVDIPCEEDVTIYTPNGEEIAHITCESAPQTMAPTEGEPLGKAHWEGKNSEGESIAAGTYISKEKDRINKVMVIK
ncbi:hypothetical protein BVX98_06660 [bacterium F11]|nr:hypothetical protein BVX98_06660 [bacterium F11]